jgi:protein-S-isoprenylcysteine O-methyltransferase Ste14
MKDAAAVRVFPPAVPLAAILLGVGLQRVWPLWPDVRIPPLLRYGGGALLVIGAALGLGLWSVVQMRRTGQDENPWKPTPRLLERGPYRITRNPMYLHMVLVCIGVALLLANAWILLLAPLCAALLQRYAIRPEEAYLERKFGDDYRAYRHRVRRWL